MKPANKAWTVGCLLDLLELIFYEINGNLSMHPHSLDLFALVYASAQWAKECGLLMPLDSFGLQMCSCSRNVLCFVV